MNGAHLGRRSFGHSGKFDLHDIISHIGAFIGKNAVMVIALALAAVTSIIVPPDAEYLSYFDFKTLTCLFCVLAVVCALKNIRFFYMLAQQIVRLFKNARMCVLALVYITFIGSMLIANDMALLTFLPLGYFVLSSTGKTKHMAFVFIMQNIAANLGGMLTPFGNPQNLYLYTKFQIPNLEFMQIMAAPFALAILLITLCCIIFVKPETFELKDEKISLPVAVLIGNEGNGIRQTTAAACRHRITIPMNGKAESLNASVAAAILIWEMVK